MTGAEVRRHRRRLGFTQVQLAKQLGVHPVTVSRWENGWLMPKAVAALLPLLTRTRQAERRRR